MQKWEYCIVYQQGYAYFMVSGGGNPYNLGNLKTNPDIAMSINMLGADGWELVSIDNGVYYFKRPAI